MYVFVSWRRLPVFFSMRNIYPDCFYFSLQLPFVDDRVSSRVITSFSKRKGEIDALTMICATVKVEMRDALFNSESHYTNDSSGFSSPRLVSMRDVFMAIIQYAFPFKYSKNVSVRSTDETNNNHNNINIRRNGQRPAFECAICLRNVDDLQTVALPCGHWFCVECILLAIAHRKSCPVCNSAVTSNSLIQIYLP